MHATVNAVTLPESDAETSTSRLCGSSDAYALARLAGDARPLAVLCAQATDAQRLFAEMAWFAPSLKVVLFPDWETLPYDGFSPHQDLISERLAALYNLQRRAFDVVIVPAATALYRLPPPAYLAAYTFFLNLGGTLKLDELRAQFTLAGYHHVTQVVAPGEYCVRGGLIDLFPMGSALPYRVDLDDDVIESIRTFDVDSQRTIYKVNDVRLLPAREFPMDDAGRNGFRARFREAFEGDPSKSAIYKDVSNGVAPAGIEYYLPLFFEATATLFDYLPAETRLCLHRDVHAALTEFWRDTQSRYQFLRGDRTRPLLAPGDLFLTTEELFVASRAFVRSDIRERGLPRDDEPGGVSVRPVPEVAVERRAADPLHRLKAFLSGGIARTLLVAETPGRRETLTQYLGEYELRPEPCGSFADFLASTSRLGLAVGPVLNGFVLDRESLAIVTESELYAGTARVHERRDRSRQTSVEGMLRDLSELRAGDPVVHAEHGIGRYRGLVNLDLGEGEAEFLLIEYADADKLYVPVAQLHLISRYAGGPPEAAPLHKLGGDAWDKAKRRAARAVRDTAAELLHLYAQRATRIGRTFGVSQHDVDAFAEGFGFEETPDQAAAIGAVIEDMRTGKPMDRLICGDVGFGKTEVALRAAFVAAADGMQVAVLTPTTLLAEQHFQSFSDRFADWPFKIAELSRFRTGKETVAALQGLASGAIDIAIGTHKLLSRDVKFARLGLVIVDEEHRFGVRHKEALKALRAEVDVLTLTATPIPRTLAMSLEGLRDLSVIATAPERRLAIKTFVATYSSGIIREACLRELKRGGQIYFLHNDVASIEAQRERLQKLLPEARVVVAHGQMRERELERVMREFVQQRSNLLVCSTIIESGIDIPTANTIIINRADRFGLAQLHQLRGRVGRSHHQAYAYLLTPGEEAVSAAAKKRLEAIQMMEELGSGFYLAMHDLEIRGAGEVLGESQSGDMQEVGFNLYADMLNHAVRSLKAGREPDLSQPFEVATEINLHLPALLPAGYCADVHERLVIYKRLAHCESLDELGAMQEELVDRFGDIPPEARALLESHRLRAIGRPLGVARLDATSETMQLQFVSDPPLDAGKVIRLVQANRGWRLSGPSKLRIERVTADLAERVRAVRQAMDMLREASK
ncbi:MAG: transcription-repair coupling factor [Betaproteobacteria bacterium RBG_16_64_18]|nr:MAG: transcription-repair coupling factor [Betaproteobacteria bacterium RBG_16_64_18]OGA37052.1 MAG: transcription-repair coupling factor [Betaproteobacteria bacterium RIFCSPLOWO2_12_FULL_65_110]